MALMLSDAAKWVFISVPLFLFQLSPLAIIYLSILALLGVFSPRRKRSIQYMLAWPPSICAGSFYFAYQNSALFNYFLNLSKSEPYFFAFILLAIFKLSKVIVHTVAYYGRSYQCSRTPPDVPTVHPSDVTVIIPTIGQLDKDPDFVRCVRTILDNEPAQIIISTVEDWRKDLGEKSARRVLADIEKETGVTYPADKIIVVAMEGQGNKRAQVMKAVEVTKTKIMAYADDHVFWPKKYLRSVLSEFEDPHVGIVGTVKCVTRERSPWAWKFDIISNNLRNFFACIYLERHNFECTATYNLDGGVFVISGRSAFVRTEIFKSADFQTKFLSETWLNGMHWFGINQVMKVDDDNFITRYMVNNGWKTVFHNRIPEGLMDNTLGTVGGWTKFRAQLVRWARTTHRSNFTSLFWEGQSWALYPWTAYAMFISSYFNIAIIFDTSLVFTLVQSGYGSWGNLGWFAGVLLLTKMLKPLDYYRRNPIDLWLFPVQVMFGYFHGLVRLWALLTVKSIEWSGRPGIK